MIQSFETLSVLALGFGLGVKHSIEADHLAAVSTIVSERKSVWSASLVGGIWGIGHTFAILVAAMAVALLHFRINEHVAQFLEFCVALMLMILGANVVRKVLRGGTLHMHMHRHGSHQHVHLHTHGRNQGANPSTHHDVRFIARPLIVGLVHGMAGSAALMLLVLSTIPSDAIALAFIVLFGVGSIGGMMLMSAIMSMPLRFISNRFEHAQLTMHGLAGILSFGLGLLMAYEMWLRG
jgi:high-affinity nickel permease